MCYNNTIDGKNIKIKTRMKIHSSSSIRYQIIDLINYINDRAWFVAAAVSTLLALSIVWSFGIITILLSR
jgi:hypothetical protein